MPTVYIGMIADVLHPGHINIIEQARQYGNIIIGLLTDAALAEHKQIPVLTYEQRRIVLENISDVKRVVPQEEYDYTKNLKRYRPDFMVHDDTWLEDPAALLRQNAVETLAEFGGELIEIPSVQGFSSHTHFAQTQGYGTTPENRCRTLRWLLATQPISRFIEAHNPLSALIAETAKVEAAGKVYEFDGFWSSSLTDSTSRGMPDIEALDISRRLANVNDIFEVTTKPSIFDGDTGGKPEHFALNVRSMERLGLSAVIIEDKTGLKKNSLFGNDVAQKQEDIEVFCEKISIGRNARVGEDFMIIARIESLILEKDMQDAVTRARAYVKVGGVDGIMIHSRKKEPDEVFKFANIFRSEFPKIPLICVPTSYNECTEEELASHGFNVVIYANHLLRAAIPAMQRVAHDILRYHRSAEVDAQLMSIKKILEYIPGTK